jgi:histidinol-phosphate aminotransferase
LYSFYAKLAGMKFQPIATRGGFAQLDVEALVAAKARLTFIANPNNPTGARFAGGEIERVLEGTDGVVVIDEAYIEYAGLRHSLLSRLDEFDNLVILRTFSKAYGLAGLRIGWLAANEALTKRLRLVKPPFNLNLYSEAVAIAALEEQEWVDQGVSEVRQERERLAAKLKTLGFRVHPSEANFLLVDPPMDVSVLQKGLQAKGILARTFHGNAALERSIRFTVGQPQHTDQLVAALQAILGAA